MEFSKQYRLMVSLWYVTSVVELQFCVNQISIIRSSPGLTRLSTKMGMILSGSTEDLRSYEATVLARKAPVNLSVEGLGGKMMRRKATGNNTADISNSTGVHGAATMSSALSSMFKICRVILDKEYLNTRKIR